MVAARHEIGLLFQALDGVVDGDAKSTKAHHRVIVLGIANAYHTRR